MSIDITPELPKTPSQELRFDIFVRAAQRYQQARALRTGTMLALPAVALLLAVYALMAGSDPMPNATPMLCGISGLASLATMLNAWMSRAQRDGCWQSYREYLERTGGGAELAKPLV